MASAWARRVRTAPLEFTVGDKEGDAKKRCSRRCARNKAMAEAVGGRFRQFNRRCITVETTFTPFSPGPPMRFLLSGLLALAILWSVPMLAQAQKLDPEIATLVQGNNDFALTLYHQIAAKQDGPGHIVTGITRSAAGSQNPAKTGASRSAE
jgi:hypothetical protein